MNLLTAVAAALFVAAPVPKAPAKSDADAVQGEWKVTLSVKNGGDRTDPQNRFIFKGGAVTVRERNREETGTFTLDPKADPKTIDFTLLIGPDGKPVVINGIYKVDGDKLTICAGLVGAARPKDFAAPMESNATLFTFERVKK